MGDGPAGNGVADQAAAAAAAQAEREKQPLYAQSTQFRHWRFTRKQVDEMRASANRRAIAEAQEPLKREAELAGTPVPTHIKFVTVEEERELVQYFIQQTSLVCGKFSLNDIVRATAIMYMKRFYLYESVINYEPKTVMATCVFLAAKVENSTMDLGVLHSGIKDLEKARVKDFEFTISEILRFEFWVRHPFEASFGIYLDCQEALSNVNQAQLNETWKQAGPLIGTSLITDAGLMYMPSQIAMACWLMASRRTKLPFEERYLRKPGKFPESEVQALLPILESIGGQISGFKGSEREHVKEVMRKLDKCRNPLYDPKSRLYRQRQAERLINDSDEDEAPEPSGGGGGGAVRGTRAEENPFTDGGSAASAARAGAGERSGGRPDTLPGGAVKRARTDSGSPDRKREGDPPTRSGFSIKDSKRVKVGDEANEQ